MQQMDIPSGIALIVQAVAATGGFTFPSPSPEVRQPSVSKGSIFFFLFSGEVWTKAPRMIRR
jgi:hypothetical protein